jgi:hypothetical protein
MAESKFSAIFQNSTAAEPEKAPECMEKPRPAAKPLGRPLGKRSDPAWKQFSVLLKKETQREAAKILRDKDEGQDLSRLVQNLLESWIKRQKS